MGDDASDPARVKTERRRRLVQAYLVELERDSPHLERFWNRVERDAGTPPDSVETLVELAKADLQRRLERGEDATAAEYIDRFPLLREHSDRVLSLVYEEFCLLEEHGKTPDPDRFCARYENWADSLASQLRYHRALSQLVQAAAPPQPRFPEVGDFFEEFQILRELGRGGAGRVYLAKDHSLGDRTIVLKVSPDRGREPAILARLQHPNIITVHSVVFETETGMRGLCMPYRPGLPLHEVIRRLDPASRPRTTGALLEALRPRPGDPGPAVPGSDPAAGAEGRTTTALGTGKGWAGFPHGRRLADGAAWLVAELARALHHSHTQGVFHRDVKPANILLTYEDGPQLLDFNLAHDRGAAAEAAAALRGGTLPYMAPEQLAAFLDEGKWEAVGPAADVYSIGLVLRELLTGWVPAAPDASLPLRRSIEALLDDRRTIETDLHRFNRRAPHALSAVVARCLAFDPADRYPSAQALAEDLDLYLSHRPLRHARNRSKPERVANWCRRHAAALAVAAAVAVMACSYVAVNYENLFVSVPYRHEFDAIAGQVEKGQPPKGIERLERWAAEEPTSAILGLYCAQALLLNGKPTEAGTYAERVWAIPEAEPSLLDWCRRRPAGTAVAESLGKGLLGSTEGLRKGRPEKKDLDVLAVSEKFLKLAVKAEPDRPVALEGLAVAAEIRKEYARAVQITQDLMQRYSSTGVDAGAKPLWPYLLVLARNGSKWGRETLASAKPPGEEALRLTTILKSVAVQLGAELTDEDRQFERLERFTLQCVRCETELTVGELLDFRSLHDEAAQWFELSRRHVDEIQDEPGKMEYLKDLRQRARAKKPRPQADLTLATGADGSGTSASGSR
ncbi:MAG: serine/threonine-protein kinase [Isosphaeraceae bacterium]